MPDTIHGMSSPVRHGRSSRGNATPGPVTGKGRSATAARSTCRVFVRHELVHAVVVLDSAGALLFHERRGAPRRTEGREGDRGTVWTARVALRRRENSVRHPARDA